jgi:hypothetical protein
VPRGIAVLAEHWCRAALIVVVAWSPARFN